MSRDGPRRSSLISEARPSMSWPGFDASWPTSREREWPPGLHALSLQRMADRSTILRPCHLSPAPPKWRLRLFYAYRHHRAREPRKNLKDPDHSKTRSIGNNRP